MLVPRQALLGAKTCTASSPKLSAPKRRAAVISKAIDDTNLFVSLISSTISGAAVAAVTLATAENRDDDLARIQTVDGGAPLGAAVLVDTLVHSAPVLNVLFPLVAEPLGAAAGVAYLMTVVLSSSAVDPNTLAPKGTVLNAEKAQDSRASVRVPFTQIVPTLVKVTDTSNAGSSGAGWTTGMDGTPKLPITSVAVVLGVGTVIVELLAHAPVLSLLLPRVLQVAFWYAAAGAVLDKRAGDWMPSK